MNKSINFHAWGGSSNINSYIKWIGNKVKKKYNNIYPYNLNAIWNLVLACKVCNNLANKGTKIPSSRFWVELNNRNDFLHSSFKPIQKTIEDLMGKTPSQRLSFLQDRRKESLDVLIHEWDPN